MGFLRVYLLPTSNELYFSFQDRKDKNFRNALEAIKIFGLCKTAKPKSGSAFRCKAKFALPKHWLGLLW
jgi:hypothetical protein